MWIRREYPYLYPLADCNGNFELDIPVILGKLKANRPDLSIRKLTLVFETFRKEGLAFVWSVAGREYVHWTGSRRRGRLPQPSHRTNKYERKLAPTLPPGEYAAYLQQFGELVDVAASTGLATARAKATATDRATEKTTPPASPAFRALTDWLLKTFQETIGKKPTWRRKDFIALALLKKENSNLTDNEIKIRFVSFLDSNTTWFQGWQLWKFCKDFDSFIEGPVIRPPTQQEIADKDAKVGRSPR